VSRKADIRLALAGQSVRTYNAMPSRPNLTRANVPQTTAMALMGDRTASVFRRYIVNEADLRDAVSKTRWHNDYAKATR
jgi:hypothetical protein